METNTFEFCPKCSKPLSKNGFFCGSCLTQVKCKSCGENLDLDSIGCTNCGTPKLTSVNDEPTKRSNSFKFRETLEERTIEAEFSDKVGQDLAEILRDFASSKIKKIGQGDTTNFENNGNGTEDIEDAKYEFLDDKKEKDKPNNQEGINQNENKVVEEYPSLKAVAMKNLPASETEWVIVYAFYASSFGEEIFNRTEIIDKYKESNRFNSEVSTRLSTTISRAVKANYINPLTDGYSMLDAGIEKAKEIINRKNSSNPSKSTSKKSTNTGDNASNNKSKGNKRLTDIDFYPKDNKSLRDFTNEFDLKSDVERNLLFTYYLHEILKIEVVTKDHLYTCYDELEIKIPTNMPISINNTATKGWVKTENSNIVVTTRGRNKIREWN